MYDDYFPLGLAKGQAFCNREQQREYLAKNIRSHQHTLITSPRRYGKSSLVAYVLNELEIPCANVDLFVALNEKALEEQLLNGIKQLFSAVTKKPEQIFNQVKNYFLHAQKKWIVGMKGVHLELVPDNTSDPAINIMDGLLALENVLAKKRQRAVMFIDEFQEIAALPSAKAIEGAIRHVAQETKYLLFIFSGSNRHLLSNMFDDRSRPLYLLCDRIILNRIDESHYHRFMNKVAKKTWKKELSDEVIAEIFKCTERHPYYVNVLCHTLWKHYEEKNNPPPIEAVTKFWQEYIFMEKVRVARELSFLSVGQRKILTEIALGSTTELTGKNFLQKVGLAGPSVVQALHVLEEHDMIGRTESGSYFLIDPLMKSALNFYYQDIFLG